MTTLAALGEVITERKFAYLLVVDYERNTRVWISAAIVTISRLLTFLLTVAVMLEFYSSTTMIIVSTVVVAVFVLLLADMYRRNQVRLRELRSGTMEASTLNTLSVKFQLTENVRVMKVSAASNRSSFLEIIPDLSLVITYCILHKKKSAVVAKERLK
ncbi:hypothetical protein OESDEN_00780 [Oesophagostomum dentatum]|uniref:Uncharacterized protein n=1 Tax=Oesophagostomum dentatum TaxID=61180 RepID=A0A0B1TNY0_OESDE|nr:hypothetical protein OESDEN_00780 [Oesophagostomum dentatum]